MSESLNENDGYAENYSLAIETAKENNRELTEATRKLGDRITIILGTTITGVGLLTKLSEDPQNWISLTGIGISIAFLLAAFYGTSECLWARDSKQPGSRELDAFWNSYVIPKQSIAVAHLIDDLLSVAKAKEENNAKAGKWFNNTVIFCAISILAITLSEFACMIRI